MKLYCATSNPGKLRELHLAAGPDWEFVPLAGVPPCHETGETFEENAVQKAVYYSRHAPGLLFAEDSGLESARYVSVIALAEAGKQLRTFRGEVEGKIVEEPRGLNGFGYDPYFYYEPFGLTFAEATAEEKLRVSHRGSALAKMLEWLSRLADSLPSSG